MSNRIPDLVPHRRVLDHGAVMLSRPVPESWGITLGISVRTGSRDEPAEWGGICHLLEHMVFKGTANRDAATLAREMERLGAQLDAFTTKESTGYSLRVLRDKLEPALEILAAMLLESSFPEDQLDLEQQVVIEEILNAEDNPEDFVSESLTETMLAGHPLGRPILGTQESVKALETADLRAWVADLHRGGNLVFAIGGEVDSTVEDLVAKAFRLQPGSPLQNDMPAPDAKPGLTLLPRKGLAQQYVEVATPGLASDDPDRFALALLASALGGGMSSRLFQRVREEEGLAYSIFSYGEGFRDTGMLGTSFSASPENSQRALDVVAEEYAKLREKGMSRAELELNREQLHSGVLLGLEGSGSQVSRMLRNELVFGRHIPVGEVLEGIASITAADVQRLAATMLDPSRQTVVAHGPLKRLSMPGLGAVEV